MSLRITLDTNVLYQALHSRIGASFAILQLIRVRDIELAVSVPVFLEYRDVLLRPERRQSLHLSVTEVEAVLRFLAAIATPYAIHFRMRPNLRDEADNMFVELALASRSHFLITHNTRDFTHEPALRFDSFTIVTPAQFLRYWRSHHEETR